MSARVPTSDLKDAIFLHADLKDAIFLHDDDFLNSAYRGALQVAADGAAAPLQPLGRLDQGVPDALGAQRQGATRRPPSARRAFVKFRVRRASPSARCPLTPAPPGQVSVIPRRFVGAWLDIVLFHFVDKCASSKSRASADNPQHARTRRAAAPPPAPGGAGSCPAPAITLRAASPNTEDEPESDIYISGFPPFGYHFLMFFISRVTEYQNPEMFLRRLADADGIPIAQVPVAFPVALSPGSVQRPRAIVA
jgi:hypothetical protein